MPPTVALGLAIMAEVTGTSAMKASHGFSKPVPSALVLVAYCISVFFMSLAVKAMPVGIVYAVWSGVGIVAIATVGWLYYGQALDLAALVGMSLIVAGVLVINLLSKTVSN